MRALVTGASRGIGRAVARRLARAGARVALLARHTADLKVAAAEIHDAGGDALIIACDVAESGQVTSAVEEARAALGGIDLLVNNAGVVARAALVDTTEEVFDRILAVNLRGAYLLCRAVLPEMLARRSGRIINVGSISSTLGTPNLSAYCASKWGLLGLTKSLAEELRESGVSVTSLLPGSVDTEMLRGSGFAPVLNPEQVAQVVFFLATRAPLAMTGATVELFE
jgi:NAD(P)-dependent dehydrogenase (short-subunit alcohol dehydrogenase family)